MTFDTTPKPFFLKAMQNQSWNVTGAIAELVDNSFGPGRGNATTCEIIYNPRQRLLAVVDNGGGTEAVGRLFQLGNTIGRSPGDIGLYGSGGTMAILWLATEVTVFSLRGGQVSYDKVIWSKSLAQDRFPQINDRWHKPSLSNCLPELMAHGHGTAIVMKIAPERGKLNISNIRRDLAKMYGPGIRAGKKLIWSTRPGNVSEALADQVIAPADPTKMVTIDILLERGIELLPVHGQIGLVEDLSSHDAGVAIGYGSRVIAKTKDCFISPDGLERFTTASVTGWLDLGEGWQSYLTTTKNAINDRPLWDELMAYVFDRIRPLLEASRDDKLTIELDEIALSLTELFNGNATVTVPRQPVEESEELGPDEEEGQRPPKEPKTPEAKEGPSTERSGRAEIMIHKKDEQYMDGVLCLAETADSVIDVSVNKDHPLIELALVQRPVNRMLLNQVVVNEIANVMAKDENLCRLAFKPKLAEQFLTIDDDAERERKILRLMADNIRSKQAS